MICVKCLQASYEVFEPMARDGSGAIQLRAAHNEIHFYTWGDTECCLERGSTSTSLLDAWVSGESATETTGENFAAESPHPARALQLKPGDVLIFEEVLGPRTGLAADADPTRRHAVRLTRVTPGEDPVVTDQQGRPTPMGRDRLGGRGCAAVHVLHFHDWQPRRSAPTSRTSAWRGAT